MVKIFVGNAESARLTDAELRDLFAQHGEVIETAVIRDKGYAFVHMESKQDAEAAVTHLDGHEHNGARISVELSTGKRAEDAKIFVGNLDKSKVQSHDLRKEFSKYGTVTEAVVVEKFGFVHMNSRDDAKIAVNKLNHCNLNGCMIEVQMSTGRNRKDDGGGRGRPGGGPRGRYEPYPSRDSYRRGPPEPYYRSRDPYEDPYYRRDSYYPPPPRDSYYDYPRYDRDPYRGDPYRRPPPPRREDPYAPRGSGGGYPSREEYPQRSDPYDRRGSEAYGARDDRRGGENYASRYDPDPYAADRMVPSGSHESVNYRPIGGGAGSSSGGRMHHGGSGLEKSFADDHFGGQDVKTEGHDSYGTSFGGHSQPPNKRFMRDGPPFPPQY